jgi:Zn-dependent M28 family amino/carboxypeptidase
MFEVMSAEVSLVKYRPLLPVPDPMTAPITYEHTADFVMQGYSGSYAWGDFGDDLDVADGGNGSSDQAFEEARGKCMIIKHMADTESNSNIFFLARDHGVAAIMLQNVESNPGMGYPPIFKSNYLLEGETEFPDIPFMMVSKSMGDSILSQNMEGWKVRLDVDVVRENREVQVVVAEIEGSKYPDELVVLGGHHDTVYNGEGAIDNTCGTVSVIEMARQLAKYRPECTVRFCTFGGEEEGLFGSTEYVAAHSAELARNLRVMLNFDMPHADGVDGHTFWAYSSEEDRLDAMEEIQNGVLARHPDLDKYSWSFNHVPDPSFGSDHAPFFQNGGDIAGVFGSGSKEYHTRFDDMSHFNAESLAYSGMVFGTYALYAANGGV